MYDVLFIDDHFNEIEETFFELKKRHIRCFYSDGENLPKNEKEKTLFKNVKYICLDYFLENRGINESSKKNAVSTLANVVESYFAKLNNEVTIIINSAQIEAFKPSLKDFKSYLVGDPQIILEDKIEKFSILHENEKTFNEILTSSIHFNLRNLVIRESITIENLIWDKIKGKDKSQSDEKIKFHCKIELFKKNFDDTYTKKLNTLRILRNVLAHENPPKINEKVNHFCKLFDPNLMYDDNTVIATFLYYVNDLYTEIDKCQ